MRHYIEQLGFYGNALVVLELLDKDNKITIDSKLAVTYFYRIEFKHNRLKGVG